MIRFLIFSESLSARRFEKAVAVGSHPTVSSKNYGSERSHFNVLHPLLLLPLFLLLLLHKECGCCFSLITLRVIMRYSDIEKYCNSSVREVGCVHHRAPWNAKPQILSSDFAFIPLILKHVLRWLVGTKHVPESKNTWTLGSVWDFGTCFGFWEMVLDPVTCFRFWDGFCPYEPTR